VSLSLLAFLLSPLLSSISLPEICIVQCNIHKWNFCRHSDETLATVPDAEVNPTLDNSAAVETLTTPPPSLNKQEIRDTDAPEATLDPPHASSIDSDAQPLPDSLATTIPQDEEKKKSNEDDQPNHTDATDPNTTQSTATTTDLTSDLHPSASDQALESALDLPPAASTVPPTVEAEQSDLREDPSPVPEEEVAQLQAEKHQLDLNADSDLAIDSTDGTNKVAAEMEVNGQPGEANGTVGSPDASFATSNHDEQPLHPASVSNLEINDDPLKPEAPAELSAQKDADMTDAPQPAKVSRERDEDMEDAPAPKRTKTEDAAEIPQFATPARHEESDVPLASDRDRQPLTQNDTKALLRAVRGVKSSKSGMSFKSPVAELWPDLAAGYLAKISTPVDLTLIEERLKGAQGGYPTLAAYKRDVILLHDNCVTFNGIEHPITLAAAAVRDQLFSKIPAPPAAEVKSEKKRKITPAHEAPRAPPARRPSRSHINAGSPTSTAAAQTFALDPSGTPLIRRDSTKGENGRPKREIHPPKPKEILYSSRPKKRKFATELKFCEEILADMQKPRQSAINYPFLAPVDPVALNIPTYFNVVKHPMDLSTIESKIKSGQYDNAKEFEHDVRLMFKNCYAFNPIGNPVHTAGKQLEQFFESEWANKNEWVVQHEPASNAGSPGSDGYSDDESEGEPAVDDELTAVHQAATNRMVEEQTKLISMLDSKPPTPRAVIEMQRDLVEMIKGQVAVAEANLKKGKGKKAVPKPKKTGTVTKKKVETKKPTASRMRRIGTPEKEVISTGIAQLSEADMNLALGWIQADMPHLDVSSRQPPQET
jgi:bromodomain-containing factor 1